MKHRGESSTQKQTRVVFGRDYGREKGGSVQPFCSVDFFFFFACIVSLAVYFLMILGSFVCLFVFSNISNILKFADFIFVLPYRNRIPCQPVESVDDHIKFNHLVIMS